MKRARILSVLVSTLLLSTRLLAGQGVWVVAPQAGPGVDATNVAAAVALAAPGDIVLVRSGNYAAVTLAKGVTVVADAGAVVTLSAEDTVIDARHVPAGQTLTIFGIAVTSTAGSAPTINVQNNAGRVWIEDCTVTNGWPSVSIADSPSATLVNCTIASHASDFTSPNDGSPHAAPPGLLVDDSSVALENCTITGGAGHDASIAPPLLYAATAGAPGVQIQSGLLLAGRSHFKGGKGANGAVDNGSGSPVCYDASPGGTGLLLTAGSPLVQYVTTVLETGTKGTPAPGCPQPTNPPLQVVLSGEATGLISVDPILATNAPVREGQSLAVTLKAPQGTAISLALSANSGFSWMPSFKGVLALAAPFSIFPVGTIPASGTLAVQGVVPELGPGLEGLTLVMQPLSFDQQNQHVVLGTPTLVTLLDSSL